MNFINSGLYGLTDFSSSGNEEVMQKSEQLVQAGLGALQYRDKLKRNHNDKVRIASELQSLCKQYNTPFIINDDLELAKLIKPDGIHLGRHDASINQARQYLGPVMIGCSCYNSLDIARKAQQLGADYVAFGAFYTSTTKPDAIPANIELLHTARKTLTLPCVAIGGITPDNGKVLLQAGADILAVSNSLFASEDCLSVLSAFNKLFKTAKMESTT